MNMEMTPASRLVTTLTELFEALERCRFSEGSTIADIRLEVIQELCTACIPMALGLSTSSDLSAFFVPATLSIMRVLKVCYPVCMLSAVAFTVSSNGLLGRGPYIILHQNQGTVPLERTAMPPGEIALLITGYFQVCHSVLYLQHLGPNDRLEPDFTLMDSLVREKFMRPAL